MVQEAFQSHAQPSAPALDEGQFQRWCELLEQRTGIDFSGHPSILRSGLLRRMRELDCQDFDRYFELVRASAGQLEWVALLNTITIKETRFFRHPEAFAWLRRFLCDRVVTNERDAGGGSLELWSVGCATGEEAYSLAMLASDCLEGLGSSTYLGVTGTDICLQALSHARRGCYTATQVAAIDERLRQRYWQRLDADWYRVVPWLQQRLCFVRTNMIEQGVAPHHNMDVIYCQNVLVYFRRSRQSRVLDYLVQRLKPGGALVIGAGEATHWNHSGVRRSRDRHIQAYIRQ